MTDNDYDPARELRDRIALLLLSVPRSGWNFTEATEAAEWMVKEAGRVGWEIVIEGAGRYVLGDPKVFHNV